MAACPVKRGGDAMRAACLVGVLTLVGCGGGPSMSQSAPSQPAFSFSVEEVFYIKPPVDRVILVGTVTEGSVRVGDSLVVRCQDGDVPVVVDGIETPAGQPQQAGKGEQVGLKLSGIRKDQPHRGDQVVRKNAESSATPVRD
jgi:selenocysteine-specific translation elongation factor